MVPDHEPVWVGAAGAALLPACLSDCHSISQLGTNFVSRVEVKRQPLPQIIAYLERHMGPHSETKRGAAPIWD
jgi:hypothetical protein